MKVEINKEGRLLVIKHMREYKIASFVFPLISVILIIYNYFRTMEYDSGVRMLAMITVVSGSFLLGIFSPILNFFKSRKFIFSIEESDKGVLLSCSNGKEVFISKENLSKEHDNDFAFRRKQYSAVTYIDLSNLKSYYWISDFKQTES